MADEEQENPKVEYTEPTSRRDLEARLARDNEAPRVDRGTRPDPVSKDGFVGVDPVYQNFGNETDAPLGSKKGAEQKAEKQFRESVRQRSGREPAEDTRENYEAVSGAARGTSAPAAKKQPAASTQQKPEGGRQVKDNPQA